MFDHQFLKPHENELNALLHYGIKKIGTSSLEQRFSSASVSKLQNGTVQKAYSSNVLFLLMKMGKSLDSHFVCKIVTLKNVGFSYREIQETLVTDVLNNPMVSLEKMRVHFNSFSTKESISRQTVRKISKKHGIKGRIAAQKLNLKREHKNNRQKCCKLIKNKPFSYWQILVFDDETRKTNEEQNILMAANCLTNARTT